MTNIWGLARENGGPKRVISVPNSSLLKVRTYVGLPVIIFELFW